MHIPSKFKVTNPNTLYQFIKDNPLGALVSFSDDGIDAIHIPFYLDTTDLRKVKLQGHIAKANPLAKKCNDNGKVLVIFHGPNAYISPNFYPSKNETGKVVPTWNYSVVHVRGSISFNDKSSWIARHLEKLTNSHESVSQSNPWSISDAPTEYTNKLINTVVGLEIEIENIVGNFKLSQNKSANDQDGVIRGLKNSGNELESMVSMQMQDNKCS
ncbi:MAG: FMN-binding negative transcriptional regulator [Gammaproteobacteria bacterium]|nr:FMN-binding negative transcriptional regulator [Gammaproteobacteria bacterium]